MSQSPRSSTSEDRNTRRATRTDAAVIAQYIQDLALSAALVSPDAQSA